MRSIVSLLGSGVREQKVAPGVPGLVEITVGRVSQVNPLSSSSSSFLCCTVSSIFFNQLQISASNNVLCDASISPVDGAASQILKLFSLMSFQSALFLFLSVCIVIQKECVGHEVKAALVLRCPAFGVAPKKSAEDKRSSSP